MTAPLGDEASLDEEQVDEQRPAVRHGDDPIIPEAAPDESSFEEGLEGRVYIPEVHASGHAHERKEGQVIKEMAKRQGKGLLGCKKASSGGSPQSASRSSVKKAKRSSLDVVYSEHFLVGSVEIEQGQVANYLKSTGLTHFGEDYYYAHTHENGILSYVIYGPEIHAAGKVSVFAPAFLNEGRYHYKPENKDSYYVFDNRAGRVSCTVEYVVDPESIDIESVQVESGIPKSLVFKWSLQKKNYYLGLIAALVCMASFAIFGLASMHFENKVSEARSSVPVVRQESGFQRLPSIASRINKIVETVGSSGRITRIFVAGDQAVFDLRFEREYDAQAFLKEYPEESSYEQGKVVYRTDLSAGS